VVGSGSRAAVGQPNYGRKDERPGPQLRDQIRHTKFSVRSSYSGLLDNKQEALATHRVTRALGHWLPRQDANRTVALLLQALTAA
jgi:hypothetical protein